MAIFNFIWYFSQSSIRPSKMILLLFKKRTLVSVFMLSAKHGPYWYHSSRLWYDAPLIGDWTQDIPQSKPGHPILEARILPVYTLYNIGYQIVTIKACSCKNVSLEHRAVQTSCYGVYLYSVQKLYNKNDNFTRQMEITKI